jgi:hypothetical protein
VCFTGARIARYRSGLGDPPRRASIHGAVAEAISASTTAREAELQREVAELKDRIAVLERIATDANSASHKHSRAIADEIESLRDK